MSSSSTEAFTSFLAGLRPEIDATIDRLVPAENVAPTHIHQAMRYSLFAGGKRVRPALVVLAGQTLGVPRAACLHGGAALELIHTYSLIHDDLPSLDDDDLRRGRPTCHRRFDEATAILAGDGLLTLGLAILADGPPEVSAEARCAAVSSVGRSIGTLGMIGGQVEDLEAEKRWPEDAAAALEAIHRRKTGELLTSCLRLAGLYANAAPETLERLVGLGELIGLLFQIGDDILDVEGTSSTLGKTAGKDAANDKLTYPGLYGLDEAKRMLERTRLKALDLAHELPEQGGLFPSMIAFLSTRKS
ncbi:MAG: polyprenyl synthetase family protein [Acidobacteriota bacterium]